MPIGFIRSAGSSQIPVWQGTNKDIQLYQGGFSLGTTGLANDTVIPAGTPVVVDEVNRTATMLDTAILFSNAGGTDTSYNVNKGHTLKVGDNFATGATGGKAYPITAIDSTTYSDHDVVTVGTTIGAATAGDTLYASTATGSTASALPAINGVLYADVIVSSFKEEISAAFRGTLYARRVPYSAAIAAALTSNGCQIKYSQSK